MLDFDITNPAHAALQARVLRCRGEVLIDAGDYKRASTVLADAFNRYTREGDWHTARYAAMSLAAATSAGGQDVGQILAILDQADDDFRQAGDPYGMESVQQEKAKAIRKSLPLFQSSLRSPIP
jgi:hypothetical protein